MATTARLLALLDLLQDRGWVSGDEIARRLEAEPRTVRRDLTRLGDLGLPVESRRGRHGGYRLRPGFRMPPLMLTDDEATAVVLALVSAQHLGLSTAAPAVDGALAKIRRVLPAALRERTRDLESSLGFTRAAGETPDLDATILLRLGEAVRHHRRVRIRYAGRDAPERDREVDPYGVVVNGRRWYLSALDHDSGELRSFRLDRIGAATLGGPAQPPPSGFDPVSEVSRSLAQAPWRWQVEIRVQASADVVRGRLPAWVATLAQEGEGFVRARIRAESLDGAARMLAGLGLPFTVVTPDELRESLAAHARSLLAATDRIEGPPTPAHPS
jgi:predicted DNA-binding transcriptional regulator YafY